MHNIVFPLEEGSVGDEKKRGALHMDIARWTSYGDD
jgi:hypothetical protein